eukprot:6459159-Prymnesium_polylepis.1
MARAAGRLAAARLADRRLADVWNTSGKYVCLRLASVWQTSGRRIRLDHVWPGLKSGPVGRVSR